VVGLAILGVRTKTRPIDRAPDFDDWEFEVYVATIKTSGRQVLARFDPSLSDARGRSRGGESGWRPA
jgi:hypothetical protein